MGTVKLSSRSKEKSSTKAPARAPQKAILQSPKRAKAMRKATPKKAAVPSKDRVKIFSLPKFLPPNSAAASPRERKSMDAIATFREKKKSTAKKAKQRKVDPFSLFSSVRRIRKEKKFIKWELNLLSFKRNKSKRKESEKQIPETQSKDFRQAKGDQ